jgi:Ca-activated chloride channel family protein
VTALYEIVPAGKNVGTPSVDPLKYQHPGQPSAAANSPELFTVKLRYKEPDGDSSKLMVVPVNDNEASLAEASKDFKFSSAVAAFGMILRDSPYKGTATLNGVWELANEGKGRDREGYREEFLQLVEQVKTINNARQD